MSEKQTPPSWDLSDVYASPTDPKIKADLEAFEKNLALFEQKYKGKLADLSATEFLNALHELEQNTILGRRLSGFAYLNMATQMDNPKATSFYQDISETLTAASKKEVFFTLELNKLPESTLEKWLENQEVATYTPWLKRVRRFKDNQLSEPEETLLLEKAITSSNAWVRLYEETSSRLIFPLGDKTCNEAEITHTSLFGATDEERTKASEVMNQVYKENAPLFTFIYNMIIKDKAIEDEKRGFAHPYSERNKSEDVPDKMVDALAETVKAHYQTISHRYYKLKAKWLNKEQLNYWDRSVPLPFDSAKTYSWEEASRFVLDAYEEFSPKLRAIADDFFTHNWIDVPPKQGKRAGAFCSPITTHDHPYLLLNFMGRQNDVLTLAHELGHGCHHQLRVNNGELNERSRMTSEEIASVFGEMLTFQKLLKETTDDRQRMALIASKVGDMLATAFRQIAFFFFEKRAHEARKNGELSAETLSKIWVEELRAYMGPAVVIDERSAAIWPHVGHFFFLPFYVYAYSFADCFVNSLYQVYQEGQISDFPDKYLALLSQTAIGDYDKLLKPFGLDPNTPDFWEKGLNLISHYLDELESLDKKLLG